MSEYENELNNVIDITKVDYTEYNFLRNFELKLSNLDTMDVYMDKIPALREIIKKYFGYEGINKILEDIYSIYDFSKDQKKAILELVIFLTNNEVKTYGLFGYAGTGKTTLSLVIANTLFGENKQQNFLELNASDELFGAE